MKFKKIDDQKSGAAKQREKWEKKIPDMYKRDDSPEQSGEDF